MRPSTRAGRKAWSNSRRPRTPALIVVEFAEAGQIRWADTLPSEAAQYLYLSMSSIDRGHTVIVKFAPEPVLAKVRSNRRCNLGFQDEMTAVFESSSTRRTRMITPSSQSEYRWILTNLNVCCKVTKVNIGTQSPATPGGDDARARDRGIPCSLSDICRAFTQG
jgi:hypothetical protein